MDRAQIATLARRLMDAYDHASTLDPITASDPSFDVPAAYAVLGEIHARRVANGWRPVGRKIGFTNKTIWSRYGVDRAMWAYVYAETLHRVPSVRGSITLSGFVQPRIEPEVVFGLRGPVSAGANARTVLDAVEWIAPGFEIVQSHFPDWKFRAADCTAAFGLHAAVVVGSAVLLGPQERDRLTNTLAEFELVLHRDHEIVERGYGRNVLGSPALALGHLADVLAGQQAVPLRAGEIVTTGTLTDAWPITPGTRWRSDYGALGVPGLELDIE